MAGGCNYRSPYARSGTGQEQRLLKALVPSSAKVDERTEADLLLFAKEYARYLNYYNDAIDNGESEPQNADGDWTVFMKMDVSVTLAALANIDTKGCFDYFDYLINTISSPDTSDETTLKTLYKGLYEFLYSLVYLLDEEWQHLSGDSFNFTTYFGNLLEGSLNEQFFKVSQYYQQSDAAGLIDHSIPVYTPDNVPIPVSPVEALTIQHLSNIWKPLAITVTLPLQGTTASEKIKYIAQHAIFKGNIEMLLKNIAGLSQKAKMALEETFATYPKHAPHYALYLAFTKLFKYAQDNLNKYTGRHLDFYYKDVLRLKNNPANADSVHLIADLAKQTETYLLKAGTVFKAGKDIDGIEMFYSSDNDVILNKGQVKSIRSIYTKKTIEAGKQQMKIFAAPFTNSGDGKGADITTTDGSWKPFGDPAKNDLARTGFSVAHSLLYMKEGTRTVILTFDCNDVSKLPVPDTIKTWFTARVTGEKGWIEVSIASVTVLDIEKKLKFTVLVAQDKGAVFSYNEKIHAAGYLTSLPVMELTVNTAVVQHIPHTLLELLQVKKIKIDIDVKGLKDISIQNELTVLDASKPFEMFGPQPHIGSTFIIGSKEIFLKNSQAVVQTTLHIVWDKLNTGETGNIHFYFIGSSLPPSTIDWLRLPNKNINVYYLKDGSWNLISNAVFFNQSSIKFGFGGSLTSSVNNIENAVFTYPLFQSEYDSSANTPFVINSKQAFIKLEFAGPSDFGHGDYIKRFTEGSLAEMPAVPLQPYTPTVKSISLDYSASAEMNLYDSSKKYISDADGHFYHLHPFGHAEQHIAFSGVGSYIGLLPAFSNEGEIFIGIENFKANQSLQVLFQVSEGSANPLKERQTIQWFYLAANNSWKLFDSKSIADASDDFTVSGIIKFGFPNEATSANTLFGEQLFFIRGVIKKDTDAACNIIQLYAQALIAGFTDHLNKGNYYKNILPSQTISKLLVSDAAIKKIQQPYNSFNGRIKENDDQFYIRVSERLRHKNRGITMWDYEHIVLQNFPEIYKVKCINHAKVSFNGSVETDNEMAPGNILVVPVPDLHNKNAIDPLKPMTSIGILNNIETFLKKIISPHVRLQVKNAKFEEIQLDFKVNFLNNDGAYYHDLLVHEIEAFLSPWAYNVNAPVNFGGSIYKSVLLNFVEERSYVDYVTCFKMYHYVNGVHSGDTDEAIATSARTVLVSKSGLALSDKHKIDYVNVTCNC